MELTRESVTAEMTRLRNQSQQVESAFQQARTAEATAQQRQRELQGAAAELRGGLQGLALTLEAIEKGEAPDEPEDPGEPEPEPAKDDK